MLKLFEPSHYFLDVIAELGSHSPKSWKLKTNKGVYYFSKKYCIYRKKGGYIEVPTWLAKLMHIDK